jgi:spore maturation protein SpmA
VLNGIFIALILGSVLTAAFTGQMQAVNEAGIESAKLAVTLAIGLIGMMALWLGFMRVLRDAGLMQSLGRAIAPLMRRLFPGVPADHPAMGAMLMNIAANMLGLGNAATPFGLKAMRELDQLNPRRGVATDDMALFLAINTSGVAVFPLGVIAIRAELGSANAGGILVPTILATACSTLVAIIVAKVLARRKQFAVERYDADLPEADEGDTLAAGIRGLEGAEEMASARPPIVKWRAWSFLAVGAVLALGIASYGGVGPPGEVAGGGATRFFLSFWLLPLLMVAIALAGFSHRVKVYDSLIAGAREGFEIAVMIIPFLVAILVAVGMFQASGALPALVKWASPVTALVGFPAEALPMALIRPLSGSGAMGVMVATMAEHGPDSFVGFLASTMNGSTETTFYVLALYFGSVRVRVTRHTVLACLSADAAGVAAALLWARLFF